MTAPAPPTSLPEVIARLTVAGPAMAALFPEIEVCAKWLEDNPPEGQAAQIAAAMRDLALGHAALNRAGYKAEDACGVPDNTFGAGGTNKPNPG